MMNSFSDYLENKILQHVFTGVAYAQPTGRYLALFTTAPTESSPGTEVTGGAYARQAATFDVLTSFEIDPVGDPGVLVTAAVNNAVIEYPTATSNWGNITHVGVFDAATSGNMLAPAVLVNPRIITTGDIFRVPVHELAVSLD
jgi:hypothetical protein